MNTADYLFPTELQVSEAPISAMLLIGSCMAERYAKDFRALHPGMVVDHILANGIAQLPPATPQQLQKYQLQYIQIPLRSVLTDRVVRIYDLDREMGLAGLLQESKKILALTLHSVMKYNLEAGLLTLVSNFIVPQGHLARSLAECGRQNDLSTVITGLNLHLGELIGQYRHCYLANTENLASSFGKRHFLDDAISFYSHDSVIEDEHLEKDWNRPQRIEPVPSFVGQYDYRSSDFVGLVYAQIESLYRIVCQVDTVKLVIFDLDNTLWRGQIAEHFDDGREWPDFHHWPVGMWETVQILRRRGIAVSICSKNDEQVVKDRWSRAVPAPWIKYEDFVCPKVNWHKKSQNIREILATLNLSAKGVVFVDDNPVERAEVAAAIPGIRVIGANPYQTRRLLIWSAETQRSEYSAEAQDRENSYRAIVRKREDAADMSAEQFLQSLQVRVRISKIGLDNFAGNNAVGRVLELTNKTNQFNTTGLKWTHRELEAFLHEGGSVYAFEVSDKYAAYGLVGSLFIIHGVIRQYVMSCRVLGMGVETSALASIVQQIEGSHVVGAVIETALNRPCQDIFAKLGLRASPSTRGVFQAQLPLQPVASQAEISWATD